MSYISPIDIQYSRLNFITMNKKYNLWTDSLIVIVYIITGCVVSIKVMFMIDYITISLAVIVCLAMWWSFLAISGLKRSCSNRLTAHSGTQKNEAPKLFDWISYIYFRAHFYKTNISFTRPDFVPQRVIWLKGWRNRFNGPLSSSIAARSRKDCQRSRPVCGIMCSRFVAVSTSSRSSIIINEIFLNVAWNKLSILYL